MKCKICGGELLFQNGIYICQSCGATLTLDSVYENIDVCICYEENDAAGRRTRDSIIAQEVYRKLEENKITTFYERISADGMTYSDLESSKLAAIHRAKIIIVISASVDNFIAIEAKYSRYFNGKSVIPFCVDVNPGAIPKTLSKIQAMSYSTIGWDKDLIKGVYNILGREQTVDTATLYGRRRFKTIIKFLIIAVLAVIAVMTWFFLKSSETGAKNNTSTSLTEEMTESTTKPLSQKEIYDNANELLDKNDLIGALDLFLQIPDHPNSSNAIKLIYAKYEGYYQSGNTTIHLDVTNNTSASIELTTLEGESFVNITGQSDVLCDTMIFNCVDNLHRAVQIKLKLNNDSVELKLIIESGSERDTIIFPLSEKSDRPIIQFNKDTFFGWLKNTYTISELRGLGHKIQTIMSFSNAGDCVLSSIDGIGMEVYLTFLANENDELTLIAISAPAEYIAPELVGKKAVPTYTNDIIYWPNACYSWTYLGFAYFDELFSTGDLYAKGETISKDTLIGVLMKENVNSFGSAYEKFFESALMHAQETIDAPYFVKIPAGTNVYRQPSYDSEVGQQLGETKASFRRDQLQTDDNGKLWGEIAWVGWICISDIES